MSESSAGIIKKSLTTYYKSQLEHNLPAISDKLELDVLGDWNCGIDICGFFLDLIFFWSSWCFLNLLFFTIVLLGCT